jgi:phage terminase large subunit-like protein
VTRGTKVIEFIEKLCPVPEGKLVGQPLKLMPFQRQFILDIYDNPKGTSRAYLSVARKNGKSSLIAGILLAHIIGPEARTNSQIISGARSRDQAALVFKLAEKMVRLSPHLMQIVKIVPSQKMLVGLLRNVEYKAISAEAGTAHGLSPVLAILDEVGQVRGQQDAFIEAIETAQGAHDDPLLIAISTQAATDGDLFSIWLDDAKNAKDKRIVSHVYSAPKDCDVMDRAGLEGGKPCHR